MIGYLSGILQESELTEIIIDVNGVGYEIYIPMSTFDKLPRVNNNCSLWIHTHVREDAIKLYGFYTKEERNLFRILINHANGVGPKLALNILSFMPIDNFVQAIIEGNIKTLSAINGLGKRTAEKITVELKPLMEKIAGQYATKDSSAKLETMPKNISNNSRDAVAALETLGFKTASAEKIILDLLNKLPEKDCSAENLIRQALVILNS